MLKLKNPLVDSEGLVAEAVPRTRNSALGSSSTNTLLVDGYGLLFRSFYAMPDLKNSSGLPLGAIYGVCRILISLLKRHVNSGLVVCLDGSGSFRKDIYPMYKANRSEPPEDLIQQFALFDELLDSMGIFKKRVDSWEADDIIAAYSRSLTRSGYSCTVVSLDKDLMQLVSDRVSYYDFKAKSFVTYDDIVKRFGVAPSMLADYLALVGDSSDNVPGVASIGHKTAAKVVNQFGSVENLYNNVNDISSPKLRDILVAGKERAFLSKRLVCLQDGDRKLPLSVADAALPSVEVMLSGLGKFGEKYSINPVKLAGNSLAEVGLTGHSASGEAVLGKSKTTSTDNLQGALF